MLNTTLLLARSKWAARSLRQLSEKRLGVNPALVISPWLFQCREPTKKALTERLSA